MARRNHRPSNRRPRKRGRRRAFGGGSLSRSQQGFKIVIHDFDEDGPPLVGDFERLIRNTVERYLQREQPIDQLAAFLNQTLKPDERRLTDFDRPNFEVTLSTSARTLYVGVNAIRFFEEITNALPNEVKIINAWVEIVRLCQQLFIKRGLRPPQTFRALGTRLKRSYLIDSWHAELLDQLRQGRNLAVNYVSKDGIDLNADEYVGQAAQMTAYLNEQLGSR